MGDLIRPPALLFWVIKLNKGEWIQMTREIDFKTGMRYVRATLGFEGLVLSGEEEKLLERRFRGEITEEEYIRKALELSYVGD
ncbi:antitoxin VbhA family protein [Bacillus velezensis]|uniref:antitoxin VbhA family protein n=2 Tax=Bacillaceae TaxID=186817 RepID=UPI0009C92140|nr:MULTISPECIES: antitoxin VbhA family protein [Bacillus]MEC2273086.1 antitoxin VbhA family protein [Bacillus velezensis]MED3680072.1 antitoxin VbhA family protein [Bacillus velezensis]RUR97636.1 hypothetical protein EFW58_02375 [Bacillus velezensis]SLC73057.1 Uncharacterised protein [Mycobacteroides abscessus subsp. massiliense]